MLRAYVCWYQTTAFLLLILWFHEGRVVSFFLVYSVSSINPPKDILFYVVHKVQDLKLRLAGSDNSPRVSVTGLFNVEEFSISFA